jgi:phage tail sheath protein FI
MPEYLYPGVYVEEIDTGNKPIEGVSTSTAGFLGIAERGPVTATLLTSFDDYQRTYGSYVKDASGADRYLAYAVEGFFQNGGLRCFVQRVAHWDPVTTANSAQSATISAGGMTLTAIGPGAWGSNIAFQISNAGLADATLFKLTVTYWSNTPSADLASNANATEVFDNLSAVPSASTFYESEINNISNLIVVKQTAAGRPSNNSIANVVISATAGLTAGTAETDGLTLIVTAGAATKTFTMSAAANLKTVADLISVVNADKVVGAKAYLDSAGHLNILDPQGRAAIAVTGTLTTTAGALGAFAAGAAAAGPPRLLTGGSEGSGPNPNLQIGATAGLAAANPLPAAAALTITCAPASVTHTVGLPAAAPIATLGDLVAAINADAAFGVTAVLDATGHLNLTDTKGRNNLTPSGTMLAFTGAFSSAPQGGPVKLSYADFSGHDPNPFALPAFGSTLPVNKTGLAGLGDVDEISLMCCPDEYYFGPTDNTIAGLLTTQCELMKDRFAILQAPVTVRQPENNNPSVNSKYAAYYFPWLNINNAATGVPLLIPPGGHITGIYARSDNNVGVQKDPANEFINGITQLQVQTNDQQQAILNPKGVNVVRYFKGYGNLVWGGRTTSSDPDWKYINVRRIFIFTEKSIQRGTQWVVFDSNFEPTWARVRRSVSDFLTGLWRDGVLQGAKKEEAFFVRCDRTTMTQTDIDNGRLICVIGIAPVKPAEFVIFRIGQWYGGSDVSEQ